MYTTVTETVTPLNRTFCLECMKTFIDPDACRIAKRCVNQLAASPYRHFNRPFSYSTKESGSSHIVELFFRNIGLGGDTAYTTVVQCR